MISMKIKTALLLSISFSIVFPASASSEVLGPLLPKGIAEGGIQVRWVHRDLGNLNSDIELDLFDTSLMARYGITNFTTISAELFAADQDFHSRETDMRYYLLGAGLQTRLWKKGAHIVSGGIHYTETYIMDKTGRSCDQSQWALIAASQLQRSFSWHKQKITVWGGPLLYYYGLRRQTGSNCREVSWSTEDVLGGALGFSVLFLNHYQFYYSFIFVDYYQPRIGFSYRF